MPAPENFEYTNGNNKLKDIEQYLDSVSSYLTNSSLPASTVSESLTVNNLLTLTPITTALPTGKPTGSIVASGSGASLKLYLYNGTSWMSGSWV
jgi:hypothetical protein